MRPDLPSWYKESHILLPFLAQSFISTSQVNGWLVNISLYIKNILVIHIQFALNPSGLHLSCGLPQWSQNVKMIAACMLLSWSGWKVLKYFLLFLCHSGNIERKKIFPQMQADAKWLEKMTMFVVARLILHLHNIYLLSFSYLYGLCFICNILVFYKFLWSVKKSFHLFSSFKEKGNQDTIIRMWSFSPVSCEHIREI